MRPPDQNARRRETERGFTIVELLVVLSLIALAVVAVPNIVAGLPTMRLRAATDDMVVTLRALHEEAIRRRVTTEFVLEPANRVYHTSTAAGAHQLPDIITAIGFQTNARGATGQVAQLRFFADGSASGGTIRLAHRELSTSIAVDWLTGRVTRHD